MTPANRALASRSRPSRYESISGHQRTRGFTLVELLVVIGIIGVLIAMLLPAVQMAREAARRISCTNNVHNWGLGMVSYEQTNKWLPYGRMYWQKPLSNGLETMAQHSWVPQLWPYIEQTELFERYDFKHHSYDPRNSASARQQLPLYFCPSDRRGQTNWDSNPDYIRSKGNYALSLSNGFFVQIPKGNASSPPFPLGVIAQGLPPTVDKMPYSPSPFALPYEFPQYDKRRKLREVTDGLSKTMLMSEQVQAESDTEVDVRGDMLNCLWSAGHFMTVNTPNSGVDATACLQSTPPQFPGPCNFPSDERLVYVSARSKHPGGVVVLFGDGSVRFVVDGIDLRTWQALGTMNGGEVISSSALNL